MIWISAPDWASKQTTTKEYAALLAESSCWSCETRAFCFGCQACLFCRNIQAARNDQMACRRFAVHEHDILTSELQKEKSGFRGVCGLVCSFLKTPDYSPTVKLFLLSFFFEWYNRFLLKHERNVQLCKIKCWSFLAKSFPHRKTVIAHLLSIRCPSISLESWLTANYVAMFAVVNLKETFCPFLFSVRRHLVVRRSTGGQ